MKKRDRREIYRLIKKLRTVPELKKFDPWAFTCNEMVFGTQARFVAAKLPGTLLCVCTFIDCPGQRWEVRVASTGWPDFTITELQPDEIVNETP
jgi:hypothetical protein